MLKKILFATATILAFAGCIQPAGAQDAPDPGLPKHEARAGRQRPVIAVVGFNAGTEVTDYVVPYGILAESGAAEVLALATDPGPIQMRPALRFRPQATLQQFDARYPGGADYVIVPNVYEGENDAALLAWLRHQASRGATIVGICDGVPTLANAGLLRGRRATGHWYTIDKLERKHPFTRWVRNTRYVADGNVITTSGVSASVPIAMALVEAIAGRAEAEAVGRRLGVTDWSPSHNSEQFKLTPGRFLTALANKAMFWKHQDVGVEVRPGSDEIRVALVADAYGRTRRTQAFSIARSSQPILTRRGLTLLPDRVEEPISLVPLFEELPPVHALDRSLESIASAYGKPTAGFVALTMEYAWGR